MRPPDAVPTIAVVIPCLDEELTIGKVVGDMKAALPGAEIIVFDNGSTDRTAEIARASRRAGDPLAAPRQGQRDPAHGERRAGGRLRADRRRRHLSRPRKRRGCSSGSSRRAWTCSSRRGSTARRERVPRLPRARQPADLARIGLLFRTPHHRRAVRLPHPLEPLRAPRPPAPGRLRGRDRDDAAGAREGAADPRGADPVRAARRAAARSSGP